MIINVGREPQSDQTRTSQAQGRYTLAEKVAEAFDKKLVAVI